MSTPYCGVSCGDLPPSACQHGARPYTASCGSPCGVPHEAPCDIVYALFLVAFILVALCLMELFTDIFSEILETLRAVVVLTSLCTCPPHLWCHIKPSSSPCCCSHLSTGVTARNDRAVTDEATRAKEETGYGAATGTTE